VKARPGTFAYAAIAFASCSRGVVLLVKLDADELPS
jgi:hypothetical protein